MGQLTVSGCPPLKGRVKVPGDKSISHRSLMFSAVAEGTSEIHGLLKGEDVLATAAALSACGVDIDMPQDETHPVTVKGVGLSGFKQPSASLDMGNSGTSTRLLMGLFAGHEHDFEFIGDASLSKRPMGRIITPLSQMGVIFEDKNEGRLPIIMKGSQNVKPISYSLPMASAQVKSAVLLAGLYADGVSEVIEPAPTRDHSEHMLRAMGADVNVDDLKITIQGRPKLSAQKFQVPSDPSSAAFLTVAALLVEGSDILIENVNLNPRRAGIYQTLIEMGADIKFENRREVMGEDVADIHVKHSVLTGINVPAERAASMIDEYPILFVAASMAAGESYMPGLHELTVKESNRLEVMAKGLRSCGVECETDADSMRITPSNSGVQGGADIETHLDHRIAMSFCILGCVSNTSITIDDDAPIRTSFPNFLTLMSGLGAKIL